MELPQLGIYKHHSGTRYRLEDTPKEGKKASEQVFAYYRALSGPMKGKTYVRPIEVFQENKFTFERPLNIWDRAVMVWLGIASN